MASVKPTAANEFGYVKFTPPELIISKQTEKIRWTDQYKDHTRTWAMTLSEAEYTNNNHLSFLKMTLERPCPLNMRLLRENCWRS